MDINDEKLEMLFVNLRRKKPELHQADQLADSILKRISIKSVRSSSLLFWIRAISGAAAVFLLSLFVYQHSYNEVNENTNSYSIIEKRNIKIESDCIQMDENKKINLVKTYLCYQKQNSLKNNQMQNYYKQFNNQKNEINN